MITEPTTKICTRCKNAVSLNDYSNNRRNNDGLQSWCKQCSSKYTTTYRRTRKQIDKAYHKRCNAWTVEQGRKRNFGITPDIYAQMLKEQNGVCKICGGVNKSGYALSVDHDHLTGQVRGLLCSKCNHGIGLFNDKPELLHKAAQYLEDNTNVS